MNLQNIFSQLKSNFYYSIKKIFFRVFLYSTGNNREIFFKNIYIDWNKKRINFLIKVFKKKWFDKKKILEVGAGIGNISKELKNLNAEVELTEGNKRNIELINLHNPNIKFYFIDHDKSWKNKTPNDYDLIIHFGLLYHLENWENDLLTCVEKSKLVALETEVLNTTKNISLSNREWGDDQALNGIGVYCSSKKIEDFFKQNNIFYVRYDDPKLNTSHYKYDWIENKKKIIKKDGYRRFWIISKNKNTLGKLQNHK